MSGAGGEQKRLGVGLVLASTVPFALSGVFTRLIAADVWTVLCWRGLTGGLVVVAYVKWRQGAAGLPLEWRFWVLASIGTLASIAFLFAFRLTYVANVALIYTLVPFVAALLEWLFLRERVRREVLVTALISALGVAVIVGGGLGAPKFLGDALALAMTGLFALYTVLIRVFAGTPAVLAGAVSSLQLFVLGMIVGDPLAISAADFGLVCVFGLSFAVASIMWTEGARRIAAAEAGLLAGGETPFAIVFAWIFLAEFPPVATLIGGAIVLGAVFWRAFRDARDFSSSAR